MKEESGVTEVMECPLHTPDRRVIARAAAIISRGGLVVYPTDTFYGLGGDPGNEQAVRRIFTAKGRSVHKPLPLIIPHRDDAGTWAHAIPPLAERLMDRFWPGPLTILFPSSPALPAILTAGTGKIGLRMPNAPIATAIAREAQTAIIATSANLSGRGSVSAIGKLIEDLEGLVDLVIDAGELPPSLGSTIVDATGRRARIVREGDIPGEIIRGIDT
ncbi:MAG: L-threonylcarbamoyladenylate synthase [bacterium]